MSGGSRCPTFGGVCNPGGVLINRCENIGACERLAADRPPRRREKEPEAH